MELGGLDRIYSGEPPMRDISLWELPDYKGYLEPLVSADANGVTFKDPDRIKNLVRTCQKCKGKGWNETYVDQSPYGLKVSCTWMCKCGDKTKTYKTPDASCIAEAIYNWNKMKEYQLCATKIEKEKPY